MVILSVNFKISAKTDTVIRTSDKAKLILLTNVSEVVPLVMYCAMMNNIGTMTVSIATAPLNHSYLALLFRWRIFAVIAFSFVCLNLSVIFRGLVTITANVVAFAKAGNLLLIQPRQTDDEYKNNADDL